jgi:hypothetical protein
MPSKRTTTVRKKATKVNANATKNANRITITAVQAKRIQAALVKAGVNYKFLDTKLANL